MAYELLDEKQFRRVWPMPDTEPVDTAPLTPALRAPWITDELVKEMNG